MFWFAFEFNCKYASVPGATASQPCPLHCSVNNRLQLSDAARGALWRSDAEPLLLEELGDWRRASEAYERRCYEVCFDFVFNSLRQGFLSYVRQMR